MSSANFVAHYVSSPSPSPSISTRKSTTEHPPWFFPGPSSRFNSKHDRSRSQNYFQRSYIPTAPVLSTATRAHRRAQSSARIPTIESSLLSPPTSDYSSRSPLSRAGSSENSLSMAASAHAPARMHATARDEPITPAQGTNTSSSSRPSSKLQDSPFSDYFTDDGHSANEAPSYKAPSSETQQLLVRLNKLQSQLMRNEEGAAELQNLSVIEKKIGEIELQLNAIHSQTRMPPELEDSGLFLEEEEEDEDDQEHKDETPNGNGNELSSILSFDGAADILNPPLTAENRQAEHDYLILEAQKVLSSVTKAQQQLRERHREWRVLNDKHISEMDNRDREIEALRAENESLKSDLGFDHSELLFLRLQFKALEVEVEAMDDGARSLERHAPSLREEIQRVKRDRVREEFVRWEKDWADVDRRMRRRRSKYARVSSEAEAQKRDSLFDAQVDGATDGDDDEDDWRLETVVKSDAGRVQKITIQRLDSHGRPFGSSDGAADEEMVQQAGGEPELSIHDRTRAIYSTHSTQTDTTSVPLSWILKTGDHGEDAVTRDVRDESYDIDCAITTSSEDNDDMDAFSDDEEDFRRPQRSPIKTAWQDLWEGIANLAGAREDQF